MATARRRGPRRRGTALVTGAGRGLGRTIAKFLSSSGTDLLLGARTSSELEATAEELRGGEGSVTTFRGDLRSSAYRNRLAAAVRERGSLELLFNNASELGPSPRLEVAALPLRALRDIFEVNVVAPVSLIQLLRPELANGRGLVVNISSDAAIGAYPGWGGYGASKAALDLLTRTLAEELRKDRISLVSVDPGDLRTRMHQDAFPGEDISDRPLPEVTLPFWAWLLGRNRAELSGHRFRAQADRWELSA